MLWVSRYALLLVDITWTCTLYIATRGFVRAFFDRMDDLEKYKCEIKTPTTRKGRQVKSESVQAKSPLAQTVSPYFPTENTTCARNALNTTSKILSAALNAGFKQTVSNAPDVSDEMPVEYKALDLTVEQWTQNMTDVMRHELYLGNIPALVKYANEKYVNGMSTRQVRAWLGKPENKHYVPRYLDGTNWAVDHIISDSIGGISHPYNFFMLPRVLNNSFSGWATLQKRQCVGMAAWSKAVDLQRWYSLKAKGLVNLGQFDPVTDHHLVQRSR